MYTYPGAAFASGGGSGGTITSQSRDVNDGEWHHIVGFFYKNIGKVQIFVDGELDVEELFSSKNYTSNLFFGKRGNLDDPFAYFFNGKIDDIRIFDREISPCEISFLYME